MKEEVMLNGLVVAKTKESVIRMNGVFQCIGEKEGGGKLLSSVKRLSFADMMLITRSSIFIGESDGCGGPDKVLRGWDEDSHSTEEVAVEGGATEGIAAGAVMRRGLRLLSITSAMQLRVELIVLERMMGFRSLILLLLDDCSVPLAEGLLYIDFASRLCFWPTSLECAEPMEASGVAWRRTDGGREEDGGALHERRKQHWDWISLRH
jgi:hypothetical protein